MVPVPTKEYGYFFKGDSYIVLRTKETKSGALEWNIHYWQGMYLVLHAPFGDSQMKGSKGTNYVLSLFRYASTTR